MPAPKHTVVTGPSPGLGRALVDGFIARGNVVFGCGRSTANRWRCRSKVGVKSYSCSFSRVTYDGK